MRCIVKLHACVILQARSAAQTKQRYSSAVAHFSSMISSRLPTFMGAPLSSSTCDLRRRAE